MYYFSEINYRGNHAGTKARNDVEKIISGLGAKPINTKRLELTTDDKDERIYTNIKNRFVYWRYFRDIKRIRDVVVLIQYPMLSFDIDFDYISKLSEHNRILFLVHDIHSLRLHDEKQIYRELELLNKGFGVILHTENMRKRLLELGLRVRYVGLLEYFDYLYDGELSEEDEAIVFAGNLEKSVFLHDVIDSNNNNLFRLYGSGWKSEYCKNKNVEYCGSFLPDIVPGKLKGKFGLVWDGDSINGCSGRLGEYTKINSPHKFSLYLASGLPVIVWKEAAIAPFVLKEKLGVALTNISDLDTKLNKITDKEYQDMKKNVLRFRRSITNGEHFREIVSKAAEQCGK